MSSFIPFRTDDLKEGECIGEDKFGNKYFENNKYFYGESVIQSAVAVAGDSERFWRIILAKGMCCVRTRTDG